jgi:hypothetical protein
MRIILIFSTCLLLLISCSGKDEIILEKKQYQASSSDTLKVNLGTFGDEEGATIDHAPVHAELSRIEREINSGSIVYKYMPVHGFTGTETVGIILNRGSDGASTGKKDTLLISIVVK